MTEIQLNSKTAGLYESYYFRGNASDGNTSFWLKHNLLRFFSGPDTLIENTFVWFDHVRAKVTTFKQKKWVSLVEANNWDRFDFLFAEGSGFSISESQVCGSILETGKFAKWDLELKRSREKYLHFSEPAFYHCWFPKKKILTRDIRVQFEGTIEISESSTPQHFKGVGMNGHNWGTEHAHRYAYANCNEWNSGEHAYFDGFSAKLKVGPFETPALTCASLQWGGDWYHFNRVVVAWKHEIKSLKQEHWHGRLESSTHFLDFEFNGEHSLWARLEYLHPSEKRSTVANTKNAIARLRLTDRKTHSTVVQLSSSRAELETLNNEN